LVVATPDMCFSKMPMLVIKLLEKAFTGTLCLIKPLPKKKSYKGGVFNRTLR
jgi:hypothetical protein